MVHNLIFFNKRIFMEVYRLSVYIGQTLTLERVPTVLWN
jgi:hypothetical protein